MLLWKNNVITIEVMKNDSLIYCIRNLVNNKVYIGLTIRGFIRRKKKHLNQLRKNIHSNIYLQHSFNKYGEENFEFVVLKEITDVEDIEEWEKHFIQKHNSHIRCYGYNLTTGGRGYKYAKEATEKKVQSSHKIKVAQYSLEGDLIKIFDSVKEASKELDITDTDIHRCCKRQGRRKDFLFSKTLLPKIPPYNESRGYYNSKKVYEYSINNVIIAEYKNVIELSNKTGISPGTITNACRTENSCFGRFFRYSSSAKIQKRKKTGKVFNGYNEAGEKISSYNSCTALASFLNTSESNLKRYLDKHNPINHIFYKDES